MPTWLAQHAKKKINRTGHTNLVDATCKKINQTGHANLIGVICAIGSMCHAMLVGVICSKKILHWSLQLGWSDLIRQKIVDYLTDNFCISIY